MPNLRCHRQTENTAPNPRDSPNGHQIAQTAAHRGARVVRYCAHDVLARDLTTVLEQAKHIGFVKARTRWVPCHVSPNKRSLN